MPPLFTIGYEQAKPAAVLGELKRVKVEDLIPPRSSEFSFGRLPR